MIIQIASCERKQKMAINRKESTIMRSKSIFSLSTQHKSNLRNIRGTFAAEGMTLSKTTRHNLDRIASGQASYQQVLQELRAKYEKRG